MDATVEPEERTASRKLRYSDKQKVEALLVMEAEGGSPFRASQVTGLPLATLYDWKHGRGIPPDVKQRAEEAAVRLAGGFEDLAERIVDSITDEVIQAANLQQRVTSAAIAVDKMRLLREQATNISRNESMDDGERLKRVLALLQEEEAIEVQPVEQEQQADEQVALAAHGEQANEGQATLDGEQEHAPPVQPAACQVQDADACSPLSGYYTGKR
jgi:hypothetical protein